jgi:hypothetical protein
MRHIIASSCCRRSSGPGRGPRRTAMPCGVAVRILGLRLATSL